MHRPLIAIVMLTAIASVPSRHAIGEENLEYQVKAAFLFNFAKFIEWPPQAFDNPDSPIVIGVLGENPFSNSLRLTVDGKTINNRRLMVKQFETPTDARVCHILFISPSERRRLPLIFDTLKGSPVLTVGESADFMNEGGVIRFVLEEDKVRFEINLEAAARAAIKLSSKLLKLARFIKGGPK
jgi:hypothetical protein